MKESKTRTVLFIGAHPDDETILAGATLSLLADREYSVKVVCATRGEGGELGEPPIVNSRDQLGPASERELLCACETMGVERLILLDYVDPTVGPDDDLFPFTDDMEGLVARLEAIIEVEKPIIILTHGTDGEYGHPAHKLIHQAVMQSVSALQPVDCVVYSVMAHIPGSEDRLLNQNDPADLVLDIKNWEERKYQAAMCHRSQHALFKRAMEADDVREALRNESFKRQWAGPQIPKDDDFATLLVDAGAKRPIH